MTIVPALEDSRSSALSCASLPEKRNCYLTTDFGDNHAEIAGLPEEDWGFSARLLGSHVKLLDSPKAFVPKFASFVHLKVAHGDGSSSCPKDTSKSSMFFGSQKTPISIEEYIKRIALHSKCSPICFIGAYVYLQRLSQVSNEHRVCSQSIHRLLITSVLIAAKLLDDKFYSNSFYARVGGISIRELNLLELEMLKALEFRAYIHHEELTEVLELLTSNDAADKNPEPSRRSKKRGNEGDQSENADALPAKLQHDNNSTQVLVTAGESVSDQQPPILKGSTAVAGLSCHLQERSRSSLDGKALPALQCVVSAGGT